MILSNAQIKDLRENLLEVIVWNNTAKESCWNNQPARLYQNWHDEAAKKVNDILGANTITLYYPESLT